MKNYEIRIYDRSYKDQYLFLQRYFWGSNETRNAKYFEWKYEHNPYMKEPVIILGFFDQQVVGVLGVYGAKWEFGRNQTICPCAADAIVHPSHRRRGLFQRMMHALLAELSRRQYSHVFAMSAGTMSYAGFLSSGWKSIGSVETIHRHRAHYLKKTSRRMRSILKNDYKIDPFAALDRATTNGKIKIERNSRPEQMAQLVGSLKPSGQIRHVRDAEYFSWRFKNPFSQYRFMMSGHAELNGYLILQAAAEVQRSAATIIDWEAQNDEIRERLIQTLVECGDFDDLFAWSSVWTGDSKSLLNRYGFQPVSALTANRDAPVLVRPLTDPMVDDQWMLHGYKVTEKSNWDLRWLYSDHCR